jgi:hypothetical protein
MRLLIAGATALLALAACQQRTSKAPGADVETGATGSADSAAVTPPTTTPDTSAMTPDTSAKKDTSKAGGMGKDTTKKP